MTNILVIFFYNIVLKQVVDSEITKKRAICLKYGSLLSISYDAITSILLLHS